MPSFVSPRRRYHFHTPGAVYIFVTVLIALGAFNSQNNLLFWAFGLALAVLIVSGIISGQMLMGIEVVREPPARAVVGQPTPVRYRVVNHARLAAAFALDISERVGGGRRGRKTPSLSLPRLDAAEAGLPPRCGGRFRARLLLLCMLGRGTASWRKA